MILCKVIGSVWATRKDEALTGVKLMIVRRLDTRGREQDASFIAADFVGAGVGEQVIVATGSSARIACQRQQAPIDATIVGIVDAVEVVDEP
jgi:ethanolamine utilization protein EutN